MGAINNFKLTGAKNVIQEFSETLSAPGDGEAILINKAVSSVQVALAVTAGSGKVQYSVSSVALVNSGSGVWADWDAGTVTAFTDDVFYPVTAIRQVNISGTTTIYGGGR